jgi:beta-lactamase regulating signal transducer with metallopeptidase domain
MHLLFKEWVSPELVQAICWTLIHSLWQGLIGAVAVALIITLTRRSPAFIRYNLLIAVLFLFIVSAGFTLYRQLHLQTATTVLSGSLDQRAGSNTSINFDSPGFTVPGPSVRPHALAQLTDYCNANAPLIVLTWLLLFLIKCTQLIAGLRYIKVIRHRRNYLVSGHWKNRLLELMQKTGIRRSIVFLESELVKVPAAIGFLKPVLLVPVGLLSNLPPEQVEAILLHELAHINRRDFLVNFLQSCMETFFFFNPAVIWISSLVRQEREACCDDMVIAHLPQKTSYLQALTSFQQLHLYPAAHAMTLTGGRNHLLNRVKRMLTQENKKLNFMEKTILLLSIIAITALSFITKETHKTVRPKTAVHTVTPERIAKETPSIMETRRLKKAAKKEKRAAAGSLTNTFFVRVPDR